MQISQFPSNSRDLLGRKICVSNIPGFGLKQTIVCTIIGVSPEGRYVLIASAEIKAQVKSFGEGRRPGWSVADDVAHPANWILMDGVQPETLVQYITPNCFEFMEDV